MSCSNCHCDPCGCRKPVGVIPPEVRIYRDADSSVDPSDCSIKGWYEILGVESFVPQEFGETQTVEVCDSMLYLPGACVLFQDQAGNKQVQRVLSRASDTAIVVEAYQNANSDETTTLSGVILAAPLAICPPETAADPEECHRAYYVTQDAFTMPATLEDDGAAVEVCFETSYGQVSLPEGATVYVEGAGYMEVVNGGGGEFVACANCHYLVNLGTTGNAAGGTNIPAGAEVFLARPVEETVATRGAFRRIVGAGAFAVNEATPIPFDTEDFSTMAGLGTFGGGGSTFTASVAGVYHFDACVHFETGSWDAGPAEACLGITVNGVLKMAGSFINASPDGLGYVGGTLHLAPGDVVAIVWNDTATSGGATSGEIELAGALEISVWSGHLVYAD